NPYLTRTEARRLQQQLRKRRSEMIFLIITYVLLTLFVGLALYFYALPAVEPHSTLIVKIIGVIIGFVISTIALLLIDIEAIRDFDIQLNRRGIEKKGNAALLDRLSRKQNTNK